MRLCYLFFVLLILSLAGCQKDDDILENPAIDVSAMKVYVDHLTDSKTIYLYNSGNVALNWTLNTLSSFLEFSPAQATLASGDSVAVDLIISRVNFTPQKYFAEILLETNLTASKQLSLEVIHFQEEKWLLSEKIIDAEYDRNNDLIIAVSKNPDQLLIINPSDNTLKKVDLAIPPKCVSVSQDGKYAVVGHKAVVSYVNLQDQTLISQTGLTFDIFDIVLAANNWVYIFPAEGKWVGIYCMNLITKEQKESWYNIHQNTKARIHPSGNYIYGATTDLGPSDFEKYDISNGVAKYLYDSPYHGEYSFDGDIWPSDDGEFLMARSGNIFSSSVIKDQDMVYMGKLEGGFNFQFLHHSSNAGRIYGVRSSGIYDYEATNQVAVYDTDFGLIEVRELPDFLIGDREENYEVVNSNGYFGFFNKSGELFHLLVKADDDNENRWAVVTLPVKQ